MGSRKVTHAFDGFAKYSRMRFEKDSIVYTMKFLRSSFYNESVKKGDIASAMLLADTDPPSRGVKDFLFGHTDNNYVKSHRIGSADALLSDTGLAVCLTNDFTDFDYNIKEKAFFNTPGKKWKDKDVEEPGYMCMTANMAHGHVDPKTGEFFVAQGCLAMIPALMKSYHVIWKINPADLTMRHPVAKVKLPKHRPPSYMHSMGTTANHFVLIAQPMHMSLKEMLKGKSMTDGLLYAANGTGTIFQVISRKDGSSRSFPPVPGFLFAHVFNTWEEGDDILLDVSCYRDDDDLAFMKEFLFKNLLNSTLSNAFAPPKLTRFRLKMDDTVEQTVLLPEEDKTTFELPALDERKYGQKYCIFYPWQGRSNGYDEDKQSTEVGPAGAVGIGKRNLCTGERSGFYAPNEYPGEVKFIPNPSGTEEDDGVLIGLVYDGNTNSSFFHVIDAKTMDRIATAPVPARTPFPLHSSFYPAGANEAAETLFSV